MKSIVGEHRKGGKLLGAVDLVWSVRNFVSLLL